MLKRSRLIFAFTLAACFLATSARAAEPLKPQQLPKLIAAIKPKTEESKWLSIPWETSLWTARQKAAAEGKPILLWEMDGNPLGCT